MDKDLEALETQQRLEEVVVAVVKRRINLRSSGLVADTMFQEPMTDLVPFRIVGRRGEREQLLHGERAIAGTLLG